MKKIIFLFTFSVCSLLVFSQTTSGNGLNDYKSYLRFDVGYEHTEFMAHNGWRPRCVAIEFEKSFNNTPFSRNYRVSIGLNDSNQFYMHMPAGPIAGILVMLYAGSNANYCTGISASTLLFICPDGFAFSPIQNKKMELGIYANFLGVDYCDSRRVNKQGQLRKWDYAPDIGVRYNYYIDEKVYAFSRVSAKYSTVFAGWAAVATVGIGFQFEKD
jgi:hypothetical protein